MIYKEIPYPVVRPTQKCPTDLFVKIKEDYRLFAAQGAVFTEENTRLITGSKIKLYISAPNAGAADEYLDQHVSGILTDPEVSPEIKADIVYFTSMTSIRDVFEGTNLRTISELEKSSRNIVRMILSDKRVMDDLISMTSHDHFTYKHSVKVGIYGTSMAINLFQGKLREHNITELSTAFFLHDIGMSKVPVKILDKKGPLSEQEWDIIKKHPVWGHERLMKINYVSDEATAIILYHHERCDRKGYPFRKSGAEIPVYAKICAVVDTFESLTSGRPFRKSVTPFEALKIMQVEMAHEFDEDLFKAFVTILGPGR